MVNLELIRMMATRMVSEAIKPLGSYEQLSLTFSKGWIERFRKDYGTRFRRVHGEAMSADIIAIAHHMPQIERLIMTFSARDTCNEDGFGLIY